jgi:hypothetical protein
MDYLAVLKLESKLREDFRNFENEKLAVINSVSEAIRNDPDNLVKIKDFIDTLKSV